MWTALRLKWRRPLRWGWVRSGVAVACNGGAEAGCSGRDNNERSSSDVQRQRWRGVAEAIMGSSSGGPEEDVEQQWRNQRWCTSEDLGKQQRQLGLGFGWASKLQMGLAYQLGCNWF